MKLNFLKNKEVNNAGWLIAGKVLQMIVSFIVGILTTRFLGPSNYGLVSYGSAYTAFFMSLCTLGINSIIIKDFFDNPNEQGEAIGTAIVLRIISSLLSAGMIMCIVAVLDHDEPLTIAVVALCCLSLVFHVFDTINYWFQYQLKSKVTAIVTFIAYTAMAVYKVILMILQKDVRWFALATSVDYVVVAILLYTVYKFSNGPKLKFSLKKGKQLLGSSYHYILSGMMVAIYGQTDKLMLKQMLSEKSVGYYTIATTICAMWVFVLQAIIDSMYPGILKLFKDDKEGFKRKNRQLYAIVFYVSLFVSLVFTVFADLIINILYGADYAPAADPLRIVTWYTAFSYLGVARNAWIVSENKQKYLKFMYLGAAILNVALNLVLIPVMGPSGAALASLVTQVFTSIILPMFIKDMRPNAILMLEAITFKGIRAK